jgi:hypothetical protein
MEGLRECSAENWARTCMKMALDLHVPAISLPPMQVLIQSLKVRSNTQMPLLTCVNIYISIRSFPFDKYLSTTYYIFTSDAFRFSHAWVCLQAFTQEAHQYLEVEEVQGHLHSEGRLQQ